MGGTVQDDKIQLDVIGTQTEPRCKLWARISGTCNIIFFGAVDQTLQSELLGHEKDNRFDRSKLGGKSIGNLS